MKLPASHTAGSADNIGLNELATDVTSLLFRIGKRHRIVASGVVIMTGEAISAADCAGCGVVHTATGAYSITCETEPKAAAVVVAMPLDQPVFCNMNGPHVAGVFALHFEDAAAADTDASFVFAVLDVTGSQP